MKFHIFLLSLLCTFFFCAHNLSAQTTTNWTAGAGTADWHTPGNWDNGVPDINAFAVIDVNLTLVEITSDATAAALLVNNGNVSISSTLTLNPANSSINNSDGLRLTSINASVMVVENGTLAISSTNDDAISISSSGLLDNQGTVVINNCSWGIFDAGNNTARFQNEGKVHIENITNSAILFNSGTFENRFCGLITSDNNLSANGLMNEGSILYTSNESSSLLSNTNTGVIHNLGSGTFGITNNNGIVDTNPAAIYWRGCESQAWTDGCNWSRDREPIKADSVIILATGLEADPVISSLTDTVMHVRNERVLAIADGGKLIIDGTPSSSQLVGLRNLNFLAVQSGGSVHVMHTTSDGISSFNAAMTNDGHILVEDARFAAIQINGSTSTFVTDNMVEIRNSSSSGIRTSFGGSTTNNGIMTFSNSDNPIDIWEENSTFVNNHSIISTGGIHGIVMTDAVSGTSPVFTNTICAVLTIDTRFLIDPNSSIINNGLINYTAPDAILDGTYTDNGYQYDPNNQLPDGTSTVLDAPRSYDFFNIDLDNDGMSFCQGDMDDVPIPLACGQTLTDQTNGDGMNNLDGYPCRTASFDGPEIIYSFQVTAPDTLVSVELTSETTDTDVFILADPSDPTSCIDHGRSIADAALSPGTYYVVVDGFEGAVGTFDIALRCTAPQTEPIPIVCGQTLVNQSNFGNILLDGYPCRTASFDGPEIIYSFQVTAPGLVISVGLSNETTNTDVFILTDPSDPTSCINHGTSSADAALLPGTYYVVVDGFEGAVGTFDLTLSCRDFLPGDLCSNALPIICGQSIEGSLSDATIDADNNQDCDLDNKGIWYTFIGTGDMITASLCASTSSFDSEITIFSGMCGMLNCSDMQNDDACGLLSELSIPTIQGDTYWIRVTEIFGRDGDFTLTFTCEDDDVCLTERMLSGNLTQSVYEASERIIVDGTISSSNSVIISAPEVDFLGGFQVEDSGLLEVDQEGCP